jgi:hypothetical protein
MPRLRRKQTPPPPLGEPETAICTTEFRTGAVGVLVRFGERRPIDHPHVVNYPEFWAALLPLVPKEGVKDG